MRVRFSAPIVIETRLGIQNGGPVHKFFTSECARQMDRFVPFRTGALAETVILGGQPTSNVSVDEIHYAQRYAKYVYYGWSHGKPIKINKNGYHPDASPYWVDRMWSVKKNDIENAVQDYFEIHGGK